VPCCDNCIRARTGQELKTLEEIFAYLNPIAPIPGLPSNPIQTRSPSPASIAQPSLAPPTQHLPENTPIIRKKNIRQPYEDSLKIWRHTTWRRQYSDSGFGPEALLPDKILAKLTEDRSLASIESFHAHPVVSEWIFIGEHGKEILTRLSRLDQEHDENAKKELEEREEQRRRDRERKEELRAEKLRLQAEEKARLKVEEEVENQHKVELLKQREREWFEARQRQMLLEEETRQRQQVLQAQDRAWRLTQMECRRWMEAEMRHESREMMKPEVGSQAGNAHLEQQNRMVCGYTRFFCTN
jgi:hypothetical protein